MVVPQDPEPTPVNPLVGKDNAGAGVGISKVTQLVFAWDIVPKGKDVVPVLVALPAILARCPKGKLSAELIIPSVFMIMGEHGSWVG